MTFRAASSGEFNATSSSITLPAGTLGGDVMELYVARSANEAAPTAPSGWTQIGSTVQASSLSLYVFQRVAAGTVGAATTDGSFTYTSAASGRNVWILASYYGVDTTTPQDVTMVTFSALTAAASTSHTTPTTTAVTAGSFVREVVINKSATLETDHVPPAGVTENAQKFSASTSAPYMAIGTADTLATAGGTVGGHTWTSTQSSQYITATMVQRTAAVPVAVTGNATATASASATGTAAGGTPSVTGTAAAASSGTGAVVSTPAAITYTWAGGKQQTTAIITSVTSGTTSVRVAVSTSPNMTGLTFGPTVTPSSGYAKHNLTSLTAGTQFYYQLQDVTTGLLFGDRGQFKTLKATGTAQNFTVAFGSCISTSAPSGTALDNLRAYNADVTINLGDFHYKSLTSTVTSAHVTGYEEQIAAVPGLKAYLRDGGADYYCTSDHEAGADNGDSNNAWTQANIEAYKQVVPHRILDVRSTTGGRWQTWAVGRVGFFLVDIRNTDRSVGTSIDNSSKTMLGATQKAALKTWLADGQQALKVIVSDVAWMGTQDTTSKPDAWYSYTTERQELIDHIAANGVRVALFHGDDHSLRYASKAKNTWGGFPVVCGSPFYQTTGGRSPGNFTNTYPATTGGIGQQYQRVEFADDGSTITMVVKAWDAATDTQAFTTTDTWSTTPAVNANATATASGSGAAVEREVATASASVSATASASGVEVEVAAGTATATATSSATSTVATTGAGAANASASATVVEVEAVAGAGTATSSGSATAFARLAVTANGPAASSATGVVLEREVATGSASATAAAAGDAYASGGAPAVTAAAIATASASATGTAAGGAVSVTGNAMATANLTVVSYARLAATGNAQALATLTAMVAARVAVTGDATVSATGSGTTAGQHLVTGNGTVIATATATASETSPDDGTPVTTPRITLTTTQGSVTITTTQPTLTLTG